MKKFKQKTDIVQHHLLVKYWVVVEEKYEDFCVDNSLKVVFFFFAVLRVAHNNGFLARTLQKQQ